MVQSAKFDFQKLEKVDMVVDWVQVTFQQLKIEHVFKFIFDMDIADGVTYQTSGLYGYNETYTIGSKIHVMRNTKRPDMGVHIQMSGSACRQFEETYDWRTFFALCNLYEGHFTRLDIAIDCYKKYFTVPQLRKLAKSGLCVSKFKSALAMNEFLIKDGSDLGNTLTFGKKSSDLFIVFYDKLKERANAGYSVDSTIDFWTRCEIRFRKDLSDNVVSHYLDDPDNFGTFIKSVLYNYIDFKEQGTDTNKSRWRTAQFWLRFIDDVDKKSISSHAIQSSIQKKMDYAETYMSKLIAMCFCCDNEFTKGLIRKGISQISDYDLQLINEYCKQHNLRIITRRDLENYHEKEEQLQLFKVCG